jgi:carboxyl-terminal processing protease
MKKIISLFLICFITISACTESKDQVTPLATMSPSVKIYLLELMDIMKANSVNKNTIDWPTFTKNVLDEAKGSVEVKDADLALKLALTQLGDNHSFIQTIDNRYLFGKKTIEFIPETDFINVDFDDIGYVKVGGNFNSPNDPNVLATNIQNEIKAFDKLNLKGWIVDLRGNGGGNMWPMIAGLGPILGEGLIGYFIDANKNETPWYYTNGKAISGNYDAAVVTIPYILKRKNPKVAVLINGSVGSSGEACVIAFKGRPNTKFFGTSTYGVSTSNQLYKLLDDASLYLTTATMADRNKKLYGKKVDPDLLIKTAELTNMEAIKWLRE